MKEARKRMEWFAIKREKNFYWIIDEGSKLLYYKYLTILTPYFISQMNYIYADTPKCIRI